MTTRFLLAVGAVMVAAVVLGKKSSGSSPPPPMVEPSARRKIAVIGDSLAVGLGPAYARVSRHEVMTYAKGSTITGWWSSRASDIAKSGKPELSLVVLGTNDCASRTASACTSFRGKASLLDRTLRDHGSRVVWVVPSWLSYAPHLRSELDLAGIEYIDAPDVELQSDGIHPTPAGYREWARLTQERFDWQPY